jgi:hypothetical protein
LDVFESVILAYPQKGHTHGPLDATFGQCCVKIGNEQFDSADQVAQILQSFLDKAVLEAGASNNKVAYKLDESPCWEPWWDELHLQMGNLTGPLAPHWFHICARKDLDLSELEAPATSWPQAPPPQPGDIVCAVKDRMASAKAHQVALLVPAGELIHLKPSLSLQPGGLHPRRALKKDESKKVAARAKEAFADGLINQTAHDFLVGWATGTAVRVPRPAVYNFLNNSCSDHMKNIPAWPRPRFQNLGFHEPRQILIYRSDGAPLPMQDDDLEPSDQLAIAEDF